MRALPLALLLCVATIHPSPAPAQDHAIARGSWMLGGSAGYSSTRTDQNGEDDEERTTLWSLNPALQYFVAEGLAVGSSVGVADAARGDRSQTSVAIGPAVDYFFGDEVARFHPFVSGDVFVGRTTDRRSTVVLDSAGVGAPIGGSGEMVTRMSGYRVAAGGLWLIMPSVGVSGELFYETNRSELEGFPLERVASRSTVGLLFGFSLFAF